MLDMAQERSNTASNVGSDQDMDSKESQTNHLLSVAQNKDKESFVVLFNYFAPRIKSFLMKSNMSPELADELAQETMLAVWHKAESYNAAASAPSTWIFTIARNKRIDHLRKHARYQTEELQDYTAEDESAGPSEIMSQAQEQEKIANALKALPEEQLTLIKKSFFEDKSHAIIADETGVPLGTVKSRIRLALERLRRESGVKELWN